MTSEYSTELSALFSGQPLPSAVPTRTINVKRMFRMRLKSMLIVFGIVSVVAAPIAWFAVPIRYTATAEVRIAAYKQMIISDVTGESSGNYSLYLQTQRALIQGAPLMQRVADDPKIRQLSWLAKQRDPVFYLMDNITVTNPRSTEILSIQYSAPNSEDAKLVAGMVVDKYLRMNSEAEVQMSSKRLVRLNEVKDGFHKQIDHLNEQIRSLRDQIDSPYAYGSPVSETPEMIALLTNQSKLQDYLVDSEGIIKQRQDLLKKIEDLQAGYVKTPKAEIQALNVEDRVRTDTRVIKLRQDLSNADTRISMQNFTYQDGQPQLATAKRERESINAELERAIVDARGQALKSLQAQSSHELELAESGLQNIQTQFEKTASQIEEQRKKDADLNQRLGEVDESVKEVEQLQKNLDRVEAKIDAIEVEQNAPARVSQQGNPTAPSTPDRSKQIQMVMLAVFASACAGVGWGLLREITDQEIRSSQDLTYITKLPILASVPHASVDRIPGEAPVALLAAEHPDSTTADEYRRILTRIIYPPEGAGEINTCLIVSPSRGDGKTSLACNLAVALAQANRRVLLVDISSRHPSIERCFDLEPDIGLSEILVENLDPTAVYRETQFAKLYVLGPGFRGRELVGKLASREIGEFFESAESQFEHVIIDTPPSLFMSDAKLLAPIVDGVIVVIGAGVTRIGMIRRCLQEMQAIGANVIGVVINGVRPMRGGYLGRNLSMYYSYSEGRKEHRYKKSRPTHERATADEDAPVMMLLDDATPIADDPVDQAEPEGREVRGPRA